MAHLTELLFIFVLLVLSDEYIYMAHLTELLFYICITCT
jgi:hypothetical protein